MKKIIVLLLLFSFSITAQFQNTKYERVFYNTNNFWTFTFSGSTSFQLQQMQGTGLVIFYWGDGTNTSYTLTSSDQTISHTYATTQQYIIRVSRFDRITKLYGSSNTGVWDVNLSKLRNLTHLTWLNIAGNLTFNSSYHTGLTYFYAYNLNTGTISITFNSSYHTGLTVFYASSLNTGTISITFNSSYHTGLTYFYANNLNTGTIDITYTTHTWSNSVNYIYLTLNYGTSMSAADVDQMCIDLNGSTWAGTGKTLRLTGNQIAAPTSASAAARASLVDKGVTVITN